MFRRGRLVSSFIHQSEALGNTARVLMKTNTAKIELSHVLLLIVKDFSVIFLSSVLIYFRLPFGVFFGWIFKLKLLNQVQSNCYSNGNFKRSRR